MFKTIREYEPLPFFWGVCYKNFYDEGFTIAPFPICLLARWWRNRLVKWKWYDWEKEIQEIQKKFLQQGRDEEWERLRDGVAIYYYLQKRQKGAER